MNNKEEIASEMHRWGRMTGAFSIIIMVTWVVLGTATTTGFLAARSSLLWPGIALAILAVIGLFGSAEHLPRPRRHRPPGQRGPRRAGPNGP